MLKYLLDTDICIYTIKRKPIHLRRLFNIHIGQICISSVTWGELVAGAEKSHYITKNLADIEGLGARLDILEFDNEAARQFGQIKASLERTGDLIGPYDMMIAGHARSLGLILVTNNVREFSKVDGLQIENWLEQ